MKKFIDLVIGGPDMSGTSTQMDDLIFYFHDNGSKVRDLRGSEMNVLFHSTLFHDINKNHISFMYKLIKPLEETRVIDPFFFDPLVPQEVLFKFMREAQIRLEHDRFASMNPDPTNRNPVFVGTIDILAEHRDDRFPYIDPHSSDVWVLEEPTFRGAGSENRYIEQNRSYFGSQLNPIAASYNHQSYRTSEFLRFRKHIRENGLISVRSRSEESACYQIYDPEFLRNGIPREQYLNLPGHEIAFKYAPTHIFVVCAKPDWTIEEYVKLKIERSGSRRYLDDHEKNAPYQVLVNRRYATDWLEKLYEEGCAMHDGTPPKIIRFNIYDSKEYIRNQMIDIVKNL